VTCEKRCSIDTDRGEVHDRENAGWPDGAFLVIERRRICSSGASVGNVRLFAAKPPERRNNSRFVS
jgi:hypothetical protein